MKDDLNGTLSHYLANMGCEVPEIKMTMVLGKRRNFGSHIFFRASKNHCSLEKGKNYLFFENGYFRP